MTYTDEYSECPNCKNKELHRDSVDIGVGIMHGPYGCPLCGWSEDSEYDRSKGQRVVDEKGGVTDQYGGYHPPASLTAKTIVKADSERLIPLIKQALDTGALLLRKDANTKDNEGKMATRVLAEQLVKLGIGILP